MFQFLQTYAGRPADHNSVIQFFSTIPLLSLSLIPIISNNLCFTIILFNLNQFINYKQVMFRHRTDSDEQASQQLQQKLSQLWTATAFKRKTLQLNKTAPYSQNIGNKLKKSKHNEIAVVSDHRVQQLKDKLNSELQSGKHRDIEIQTMQQIIVQLRNQNKQLHKQIDHMYSASKQLPKSNKDTVNQISTKQKQQMIQKDYKKYRLAKYKMNSSLDLDQINNQSLSKQDLIHLLQSTSDYQQFVEYYNDHQLSFMNSINNQRVRYHKNGQQRIQLWKQQDILQALQNINNQQQMGLKDWQMQLIRQKFRKYYETHQIKKIKSIKANFNRKIRSMSSLNQNSVAKQLQKIRQHKEIVLVKQRSVYRNKSTK